MKRRSSSGQVRLDFRRGETGAAILDGLELRTNQWHVSPLEVSRVESSFFRRCTALSGPDRPFSTTRLLMRAVEHEWHAHPVPA